MMQSIGAGSMGATVEEQCHTVQAVGAESTELGYGVWIGYENN